MTGLSEDVLAYIAKGLGQGKADQLDDFLRFGKGQLTMAKSHPETVQHALMLWTARAASTNITGVRIEGIADLVGSLRSLDPEVILERYDVQDGRALLTFYRDKGTKRPVGYQFVNTPASSSLDSLYEDLGVVLTPAQRGSGQLVRSVKKKSTQQRDLDESRTEERARRA